MGVGTCSSSARVLSELQGVRLVNTSQVDTLLEEDRSTEHPQHLHLRTVNTVGNELFPGKRELRIWRSIWDSRPDWFKVLNCQSNGDRTLLETIVNVATSMPFIAIGLQVPRTKPSTRLYANSLVGVGVASSMYHISRGEVRKVFRFGDYAMIAIASVCLNSAIKDDNPKALMLASALLIPVQPMLVSVLHTGIMEATFARRVSSEPKLRRAHSLHKLSSIIGGALFVADDVMPHTPYIHAAWHLAAALGVATCTELLE